MENIIREVQKLAGSEAKQPFSLVEVVKVFAEIAAIHRPSQGEEQLRTWLIAQAKEQGCDWQLDECGNCVIRVPACQSQNQQLLIIQSHIDMVCVAPPNYDWQKKAVQLRLEGEWLMANNTTLGADNGIGVALMVLLLRNAQKIPHPPLELLFTVAEEVGLIGARQLDTRMLNGNTLLNLDSEESEQLTDSSAGGQTYQLSAPLKRQPSSADYGWKFQLAGLPGGHSGLQIANYRGNAVLLLLRCLGCLRQQLGERALVLLGMDAGRAGNVIPSSGCIEIGLLKSELNTAAQQWSQQQIEQALELALQQLLLGEKQLFPQLNWQLTQLEPEQLRAPLDLASTRLFDSLALLPDGVFIYNHYKDLVELSANLAQVSTATGQLRITNSLRYTRNGQLEWLQGRLHTVSELFGLSVNTSERYSSWPPSSSSALRTLAIECYQLLFGQDAKVVGVHAGLECGVIVERFRATQGRHVDALSIGPTIEAAHSNKERLFLPGLQRSSQLLLSLLEHLARGNVSAKNLDTMAKCQ